MPHFSAGFIFGEQVIDMGVLWDWPDLNPQRYLVFASFLVPAFVEDAFSREVCTLVEDALCLP